MRRDNCSVFFGFLATVPYSPLTFRTFDAVSPRPAMMNRSSRKCLEEKNTVVDKLPYVDISKSKLNNEQSISSS